LSDVERGRAEVNRSHYPLSAETSSSRSRLFSGCTGRAFNSKILANDAICFSETSIGVVSTSQRTPSEQGGVVSEPLYVLYSRVAGSRLAASTSLSVDSGWPAFVGRLLKMPA